MKLGEIKLEALRIMNINNDSVLSLDKISTYSSEARYARFLNNMTNSINRAIDIINHKKIIPEKTFDMSKMDVKEGVINNRYSLLVLDDFISVSRIVYEDEKSGYREKVPFEREGNNLVVSNKYLPESLILLYNPKVNSISEESSNNDELIDLPDELARLIPYFIKFDLYQEDEPNIAVAAKSVFEQGIENLRHYEDEQEEFYIEKVYACEV